MNSNTVNNKSENLHSSQGAGFSFGEKFESYFRRQNQNMERPARNGYFGRPLAPAPWPALLGVVIFCWGLLAGAAGVVSHDFLASGSCFLVLLGGAVVLDYTGRLRAQRSPHPLYKPQALPAGSIRVKITIVLSTFSLLITYVSLNVRPGEEGSPLPYFLAAGFLFLVMPQLLARHVIWSAERSSKIEKIEKHDKTPPKIIFRR